MRVGKEFELAVLYVFRAPVVLAPPNEGWSIPKPLMDSLIPSRIINVLSGDFERELASIADMVIHLWNTSLKYPIPAEYVRIYSYYANKLLNSKLEEAGLEVPRITEYEEELAKRLRRRIFRVQIREVRKMLRL